MQITSAKDFRVVLLFSASQQPPVQYIQLKDSGWVHTGHSGWVHHSRAILCFCFGAGYPESTKASFSFLHYTLTLNQPELLCRVCGRPDNCKSGANQTSRFNFFFKLNKTRKMKVWHLTMVHSSLFPLIATLSIFFILSSFWPSESLFSCSFKLLHALALIPILSTNSPLL